MTISIAEGRHIDVELLLDRRRYARLAGENLVERHARHMAEHHLFDIGLNLRPRVGQAVIGGIGLLRPHAGLHRNRNGDEDIVLGLGLHGQGDLIDAQAHPPIDPVDEGNFPVQPRLGDAQITAEAGDDRDLRGLHREKAADNRHQQHEDRDGDKKGEKNLHGATPTFSAEN